MNDRWLLSCLLAIFTVLSISALIQYGLASAGFYFAGAAIFVAFMSIGSRAGFICIGFFSLVFSIIAYLWATGFFVFPGDANEYLRLPTVWATLATAFFITTAILFFSSSVFMNDLNQLIDTVDEQRRKIEKHSDEVVKVNRKLEIALKDIKTLSGLLPICTKCKKIRDDQGYWQQVEQYVQVHSDVTFTHGLCPECIKALYPEFAGDILKKLEKTKKR